MKRSPHFMMAVIIAAWLTPGISNANDTASRNSARYFAPYAFVAGSSGIDATTTALSGQGWSLVTYRQDVVDDAPSDMIGPFVNGQTTGQGAVITDTHGSARFVSLAYFHNNIAGWYARDQRLQSYNSSYGGYLFTGTTPDNTYSTIDFDLTYFQNMVLPAYATNAFVFGGYCSSLGGAIYYSGSACFIGYASACPGTTVESQIQVMMNGMKGDYGLQYRSIAGILGSMSGVTASGNTAIVLAPVVISTSPGNNAIITGPTDFTVHFDCNMNTAYPAQYAFRSYGTGYVQLSNAKWVDSQNLKVTATPCQNGSGSIHVVASNCVSANSFYLKLDGDRHGPAGDDYPIPITVSSDQTCYNALAMFEGCFAWPEADGIHIGGYIPWHQGTTGFRIYGDQFHQTVLKEVGDASALNPYWFETVVPGPPRAFYQVAELTAHGEESLSPIIKCGSPPENLAVLRMTNQRSQLQPPFASTSIDKLPDNDGSSTAAVTDFVVLVPDTFPQFQSAIQPVVSAWQASGKTVQVWSISKDLNQARKLLKSIHDAAVSNGIPPDSMPQVQIIGGPLTTLGPIYTADSTGSCLFGNCASILNIADFNGDGRADMPVMQLPVDSLGQLQNADQTKLQHMQTYLHPVGPSLFAYGDIPGYSPFCAPLAEPAATLRGIETQVNILGQPTISIRQSQFSPDCSNYDSMQTRMVAMMNGVISSSQGMAYYTNRSIFDVMLRRVDMAHPFTISMLRRPQVIWINAFGCDMADILRVNPYAPTPAEQLLHANPNINTAAVSIIGNLRAGYLFEHLEYARLYNKNAASGRFTTNAQVLRQTQQDLCDEGLCEYAQGIVGLGWIADLPVYHTVVSVEAPAPGDPTPQLWLGGPNPFSSRTTLRYVVSRTQPVNLTVIDVGGRAIKTLVNTTQPNGVYAIDWNGTDNEGRRVASSVYFVKLAVGNKSRVVKLTLLH